MAITRTQRTPDAPAAPRTPRAGASVGKSKAYSLPAVTRTLRIAKAAGKKTWKIKNPAWLPSNAYQKALVALCDDEAVIECEKALKASELKTKAVIDKNAGVIDVTTILDVNVEWLKKGADTKVGSYKGVELSTGFTVVDPSTVVLRTKSGDFFYLHKTPVAAANSLDVARKINALHAKVTKGKKSVGGYEKVRFPLVSVDLDVNMKPLEGLDFGEAGSKPSDADHYIGEASQKVKFSMDTVGAKVKVEVKIKLMTKGIPHKPKIFTISGPFTVWAVKPGQSVPYFTGVMGRDAFTKSTAK